MPTIKMPEMDAKELAMLIARIKHLNTTVRQLRKLEEREYVLVCEADSLLSNIEFPDEKSRKAVKRWLRNSKKLS